MTLTNIFGHWMNVNTIRYLNHFENQEGVCTGTYICLDYGDRIRITDKTPDEVAHEINRKSVQINRTTDNFKFELRPISEIETVTDYNQDKDVLIKMSEYSYGTYSFGFVLNKWNENSAGYWTHFALLP